MSKKKPTVQMRISEMAMRHRTETDAPNNIVDIDAAFAREAITLILSAFHDGRLDEELGVVGRWVVSRASPKKLGLQSWSVDMSKDKGATIFIALRPLTGTGKEGEA